MFYKNISFNLIGIFVPFLIAIPAMGMIAREIGVESFGLFTLALAISGTASILDMGTTKALVREVALHIANKEYVKKIFFTALFFVFFISIIFSVFGIFFQNFFVEWLNVEDKSSKDLQNSIILIFSIFEICSTISLSSLMIKMDAKPLLN